MSRTIRTICVFGLGALAASAMLLLSGAAVHGRQQGDKPAGNNHNIPVDPAAMDEAMQAWMRSMRPGEQHEWLKRFVGEWDAKMEMFTAPGQPPMQSTGSATFELIMDGRYLVQKVRANMMGMPMEGLSLMGYDNNRKLFFSTWIDNMGTGVIMSRGNLDKSRTTLTTIGDMDEPMTGEIGKPVRYQTTFQDDDHFTLTIDEVLYGEPFTAVRVEYTRKKQ